MSGPSLSSAAHFFGYGSLVNRATHAYPQAHPAHLKGWRRVWVHTAARPVAYLSVRRDENCTIAGLAAHVPGGDWAALDEREAAYARHAAQAQPIGRAPLDVQVYAVPQEAAAPPQTAHPILLSYLDAVVQGFLREFGEEGVAGFFETTSGWDAPIRNDRAAPLYPRAQRLSALEIALVDAALAERGALMI
jgi:hypothetical protein